MSDTFMAFVEETARAAEKRGEERGKAHAGHLCAIRLMTHGSTDAVMSHVTRLSKERIQEIRSLLSTGLDEDGVMRKLHERRRDGGSFPLHIRNV